VGQATSFLLPKIVAHARNRAPVLELGNLDVARDFSDVRTVADAYARLLSTPAAVGQTFNICSGHATSLQEVVELVSRISGQSFDVQVNPAFVRSNEVRTLCGSPSKLERAIGPLSRVPLEETLRWMLES
jgi:nucleoside-diphosphate-sugar epimerase